MSNTKSGNLKVLYNGSFLLPLWDYDATHFIFFFVHSNNRHCALKNNFELDYLF